MSFTLVRRIIHRGETQTQTTEVSTDLLRIGRGTANDLRLDDLAVALNHATIEYNRGRYVVRDLTSLNATYINQVPFREATVVHGDVIRIGPYALKLSLPSDLGALTILTEEVPGGKDQEKIALLQKYQLASARWTPTALSVTMALLILGGTALSFGLGQHRMFMPGGISLKHSQFADQCMNCHAPWKAIWAVVPDKTCQTCHAGPSHFGTHSLTPAPQCARCHVEHKEKPMLAFIPDSDCIQCHADLSSKDPRIPVHSKIHEFNTDHPEFAVSITVSELQPPRRVRLNEKAEVKDSATLLLNHKIHLNSELRGPDGPEPLKCASCHQLDEQGSSMKPITYEKDCLRCHLLDFDDRLPGTTVSHRKQPAELRAELQAAFYAVLTREIGRPAFARRLPGAPKSREERYIEEMTAKAEQFLLSKKSKKCLLCHVFDTPRDTTTPTSSNSTGASAASPVVRKTLVPNRWLPYGKFDHAPHLGLPVIKIKGCIACHETAPSSQYTADVLLPGIKTCQTCHFEPGGAQAKCITCHSYHDKTRQRLPDQPQSMEPSSQAASSSTSAPPIMRRD